MKICPTCRQTHADEITFCPHDGTRLPADAARPDGRLVYGQYKLETLIAETPNGQLYRAHDVRLDRRVALEMFNPELSRGVDGWLYQLRRDLRALFHFGHPNIVSIYHITDDSMVMEFVEGQTLNKELRERGRFTPREVAELLEPVADALDAARARGIACAFLTPADIIFRRAENNLPIVKLLPSIFNRQFIKSDTGGKANPPGAKMWSGAALYVAPELLNNDESPEVDARALVYSLGVISYELISGLTPYDALTVFENALKHATGQHKLLTELAPDVPPGVARVVERALTQKPEDRPATAVEFVSELQVALGMKSILTRGHPTEHAKRGSMPRFQTKTDGSSSPPADASTSSSAEVTVADKPIYLDENVQFTVYQPEAVAPARWHTLLAFAHLSKRRADAPTDEPEPLAEVKRLAARVLAEETAEYDAVKQNSLHAVPHRGEITFVPEILGCEFNPPRQSFSWQKSVHKVEFEMLAAASLDGQVARGRLTVLLGSLILADVPLAIRVDSAAVASINSDRAVPTVPASATPYRKIFPSYSHKDHAIVEQIEHHVRALGDKYLRDVTELRAGQAWQRWMREAIEEADMFQLFWSHNSMHSVYVREEWEYALSLGRPNFVRPTYWEMPLPESPAENLPPAELRQLHFQYLRANYDTDRTTQTDDSQTTTQRVHPTERGERGGASAYIPSDGAIAYLPSNGEIVCSSCGGRYAQGAVFCGRCGAKLIPTAQSSVQPSIQQGPAQPSHQPATASPEEVKDALNVFWEKREREAGSTMRPSPLRPYPQSQSPRGISGRRLLWPGLLLLLLALLLGVYLLVRLL